MTTLLLATRNKGKIKEVKRHLADIPYEIKTLDDLNISDDVEEKGISYEENALLKAKTIGDKTKILTLGEDSGLEIDIFDGWPGIYSARHTIGTDEDKIDAILGKMNNIPEEKRTAKYKSVAILYDPSTKSVHKFEGSCEGFITEKRIGTHGFGYDPIFWSQDLGKTFGTSSDEEKNKVSHRGRALLQLKKFLLKIS